ncbi:MAG: exosortase-associated EpsI family protein [Candidatus Wallbacteria bacterium]|nr:exosortase-associated EpsI family protein [Candidatus Wallbacteria bacterium]
MPTLRAVRRSSGWVRYPLEVFLGFPLRLLSTRVAAGALSAFGIPALRTGTVLTMPGFTLQIGSPCSGLNTITGVLMIVAFHSILTGAGWMEAAVLLLASLPAALLANALRIVAIGAVGSLGRADLALGVVHDWSGFVTFAVALAVLFVLATVLRRRRAEPGATPSADAHTDVPSVDRAWVLARVLTLLMAVGTADWILARSSRQGSLPDLHSFPAVIVAAQAAEEPLTDEERELQVDTGGQIVRRVYRTGEQTVWAALVTAGASWRVHHPPEFCYTAQGWTVLQNSVYEDPGRASYRELLAERDGERRVIQYWFTDGNRSTTNLMDRWFQGLAAAFRGQSGHPWLMVTLSARETDVEALDRLRGEIRKTADSWIAAGPGVPPSS